MCGRKSIASAMLPSTIASIPVYESTIFDTLVK